MVAVAVLGLGRMGAAMASRLAAEGHEVGVWNRTASRARELASAIGAAVLARPAEAGGWPLVVCSLADDAALDATYLGVDGLLDGLHAGTVVLETSTVDPRTIGRLAPAVAGAGASLLDAPVSGSVPAVQAGTLAFMVGGDAGALETARPVLDSLGARVFHLGSSGSGAAMKLAVNSLVHGLNGALSEALVLAEAAGIDRTQAYEVFLGGAAAAPFLGYKRAAFERPEDTPPAFSLALAQKDLELIAALAERLGAENPQGRTNLEVARGAVAEGHGERDMSWLAQVLRDRASGPDAA